MSRPAGWMARLVASSTVVISACGGGRSDPPPSPTSTFEPAVVSVIETVQSGETGPRAVLESGLTLTLDGTQLRNGFGQLLPGELVLAGPGASPPWWTALPTKHTVHPSGAAGTGEVPDGLCWSISGGAFDEGGAIHFSSGLRLQKAAGFHVGTTYVPDPFPARASDSFCVDRDANVTSLDFIWVGGY